MDDSIVAKPDFLPYALKVWKVLKPLNDYMNKALE
jgi:hypothetical protein